MCTPPLMDRDIARRRSSELLPTFLAAAILQLPETYTMTDSRSVGPGDENPDWKTNGLRIIRSGELDSNTPQTPGMTRAEAISRARVGAQKLWAGTVVVHPNAKTGPHHHGELETVIYVVRGRARFRW
jgi:hypothetical protein